MPRNSGPAARDLFPGHGAGKGDADRSPKWRENYDDINWKEVVNLQDPWDNRFIRVRAGVKKKTYK